MRDYFGEKAAEDLVALGIQLNEIQRLAQSEHIEIEVHPSGLAIEILNAASEISWEYLVSAATRSVGRFQPVLITRCLSNDSIVPRPSPQKVLFIESAPGRIGQIYNFEDEETRIRAAVKLEDKPGLHFARTQPYGKLKRTIAGEEWQAIHVTGVDTHQAAWLIEDFYSKAAGTDQIIDQSKHLQDGMILRGDTDSELAVCHEELAGALLPSPKRSDAVFTLNLYYSAARTARELVHRGAYAALGFLDEIDDEFAERFFQAFYWAWCHHRKTIPQACLSAWDTMDSDRLHGTSIVVWLGHSILSAQRAPVKAAREAVRSGTQTQGRKPAQTRSR
jgi:hypothetical protein